MLKRPHRRDKHKTNQWSGDLCHGIEMAYDLERLGVEARQQIKLLFETNVLFIQF